MIYLQIVPGIFPLEIDGRDEDLLHEDSSQSGHHAYDRGDQQAVPVELVYSRLSLYPVLKGEGMRWQVVENLVFLQVFGIAVSVILRSDHNTLRHISKLCTHDF